MIRNRLSSLIKILDKKKIDGLLISKPENAFYLTAFTSTAMSLIISRRKNVAITDSRYIEAAAKPLKGFEIIRLAHYDSFAEALALGLAKARIKRLGFESHYMTVSHYKKLKKVMKRMILLPTEGIVESLREIKDASEINTLKEALTITKKTLRRLHRILRPHTREIDLVRSIRKGFVLNGADGESFEPIVAGQPQASQPHYRSTAKMLGHNTAVVIDLGARKMGYNSDLTRVYILGKISPKFDNIYNILRDAKRRAIDLIRPGAVISDIDNAAREYLGRKGFGKFFVHALGHGLGLEVHERPNISSKNRGRLREGMVFTIEPGIYIPGFLGLRIEDTVEVCRAGAKVWTDDID